VGNKWEEKPREAFPEVSNDIGIDFDGFANSLLKEMGFASPQPAVQPARPTPPPQPPQPQPTPAVPPQPAVRPQPAVQPARPTPPPQPQPTPAVQPQTVVRLKPAYVPPAPAYIPPEPEAEFFEPEPAPPKRAKWTIPLFPETRGDHIRFILVIVAILLFEMIFLGFLANKGVLDISIFN
jgi:hypothetical protein